MSEAWNLEFVTSKINTWSLWWEGGTSLMCERRSGSMKPKKKHIISKAHEAFNRKRVQRRWWLREGFLKNRRTLHLQIGVNSGRCRRSSGARWRRTTWLEALVLGCRPPGPLAQADAAGSPVLGPSRWELLASGPSRISGERRGGVCDVDRGNDGGGLAYARRRCE